MGWGDGELFVSRDNNGEIVFKGNFTSSGIRASFAILFSQKILLHKMLTYPNDAKLDDRKSCVYVRFLP